MKWPQSLHRILDLLIERPHLTRLGLDGEPLTDASGPHCREQQPLERKPYPLNAAGPFYSVEDGCITCLAPQCAAPNLIGLYDDPSGTNARSHCFFKKQPQTQEEVDEAISAMAVSCVENLRYGGTDPVILNRLCQIGFRHLCDALEDEQAG